jgi:glutamate-1-semialdehyde 2,1-aminomutase
MVEQTLQDTFAHTRSFRDTFTGFSGHALLPGGYGRSVLAVAPRTPMAVRGTGCHLRDDAGRTLIDVHNNFASLLHGYAHPVIDEAVVRAMRDGAAFGLPNMFEVDHARLMLDRLRGVDQIRYTNSGTEAFMLALRVARAVTGRDKIVVLREANHGFCDAALVSGGVATRRGIPDGVADDILAVPVNDLAELAEVFDRNSDRIAALVVDPLPGRAGLSSVDRDFWTQAYSLCTSTGALLVSDEVMTLRLAYEGAATAAGVSPDLLILGKIIGGGTPVGALAGRAECMAVLDPLEGGLAHGGTFNANPVSMAAGVACMRMFTSGAVERLNQLGDALRTALAPAVNHGWQVRGAGSLFQLYPADRTEAQTRAAQQALWWAAYDNGVLLTQDGCGSLSTPMAESTVDEIADRLGAALVSLAEVVRR